MRNEEFKEEGLDHPPLKGGVGSSLDPNHFLQHTPPPHAEKIFSSFFAAPSDVAVLTIVTRTPRGIRTENLSTRCESEWFHDEGCRLRVVRFDSVPGPAAIKCGGRC